MFILYNLHIIKMVKGTKTRVIPKYRNVKNRVCKAHEKNK